MSRPLAVLLALPLACFLPAPAARAADDEPLLLGKKLSEWIKKLHEDKDVKERRRALIAVENIADEKTEQKVAGALSKALREDRDESVRESAALALGRIVSRSFEQARADKKEDLPRFDGPRDSLGTALRTDKSPAVRAACARALGDVGRDFRAAVGALAIALKDKDPATQSAAAVALRRMGPDGKDAQDDLRNLLADPKANRTARRHAADALGVIDADPDIAVPALRDALADGKAPAEVRKAASDSLARFGRDASPASSALAAVLIARGSPADLRLSAATALDQIGPAGRDALPALVKAVAADPDRLVRIMAMHAIGRMGRDLDDHRKAAVEALLKCLDDSSLQVQVSAIETLGALGPEGLGEHAGPVLKRLDRVLAREGRKAIREAAEVARKKIEKKSK
jgi:HEAT repeat protein